MADKAVRVLLLRTALMENSETVFDLTVVERLSQRLGQPAVKNVRHPPAGPGLARQPGIGNVQPGV
jgi:hypothetical protein